MNTNPVVKGFAYQLIHTPDFVRYGSKPWREWKNKPELGRQIAEHLRTFQEAVSYRPNQVFIGNLHPEDLAAAPEPWWKHPLSNSRREGAYGRILDQEEYYAFLKVADQFDLVWLTPDFRERILRRISNHPLAVEQDLSAIGKGKPMDRIRHQIEAEGALPLYHEGEMVGAFLRHHDEDESLQAHILMENLVTKASGALVVREMLHRAGIKPDEIDYILSCSEEAVGDRYNRGGGNMAKAVGEMCGLVYATGSDVKAFCAAPIYALVHGASLVKAGVFEKVVVFGGGCLAKMGMKFEGHLKHGMPILEDMLGCIAFLITADDGTSPVIRLDSVGKHRIGDGSSQQEILTSLVVRPLERLGMGMKGVDKIATELHNPEITVPQGSGNVPLNNYKLMAALAVLRKEISREEMTGFISDKGMPGFCPTQGHIPAAVPYLGHAAEAMAQGRMQNALFVAKGSLFLGRMSHLSDGMSFLLERNKG